jgi:hypothetical protein
MCLACAIPVRGKTLGAECLLSALGPHAVAVEASPIEPGRPARLLARIAFVFAVLATILPWSRFGAGAEPFGAWSSSPKWSLVAAIAAVAGLSLSLARRLAPRAGPAWDVVLALAGAVVVAASALALFRPPEFTSPWLGPWAALVAGLIATGASVSSRRMSREREPAHI